MTKDDYKLLVEKLYKMLLENPEQEDKIIKLKNRILEARKELNLPEL